MGAPYTPRPAVFPRPALTFRSPLAAPSSGQALSPRYSSRLPGLEITKHHQGFTHVHPPGLPLARLLPQTEQGPLSFNPGLRTPTDKTRQRTPGRGSILNTDRELRTRHDRPPTASPLGMRDLVSHVRTFLLVSRIVLPMAICSPRWFQIAGRGASTRFSRPGTWRESRGRKPWAPGG